MPTFRLTIRPLGDSFHGRGDGDEPEWPPSPLRAFQALVNAAARRWDTAQFASYARSALEWLEGLGSPEVVAPHGRAATTPYRLYVPNNAGDLMVSAWARGDADASMAGHRTEKDVRPVRFADGAEVHFDWSLTPEQEERGKQHFESLKAAARSITHLGWGVDMVVADAKVISQGEADKLPGHRWRVVPSGGVPLRVPKAGTLANLTEKHTAFLGRLSADGFKPVPPLHCFDVVGYACPTAGTPAAPRPTAAFEIHRTIEDQEKPEFASKSRFRPYHHVRHVATVAGMVRHAAATVAGQFGKDVDWVNAHVLGHGDEKDGQATSDERLMYLPLPSITPNGVSGVRRVLVVGWPGCAEWSDLRRRLNGCELIDRVTCQPVAMLSHVASADKGVTPFTDPARTWSTVTPVILPGHDDPDGLRRRYRERVASGGASVEEQRHLLTRLDTRILSLLWKAFHQAGWSSDELAGAELEYRSVGWFRGLELANNYELPPLKFPRYHVRVRFTQAVSGPLVVGAGRYRGFGIFARDG